MPNLRADPAVGQTTTVDRRTVMRLAIGAAVGAALATRTTTAQMDDDVDSAALFMAAVSGDQQTEPVDTEARGGALFSRNQAGDEVEYTLHVHNIEAVTMAHIHLGAPGEDGPIAVWLYPGPDAEEPELQEGRFDGVLASDTFTEDHLTENVEEGTLDALVEEMADGNTYVNVHTETNPGGEIRGRITPFDDAVSALTDESANDTDETEGEDAESAPGSAFVDEIDGQVELAYGDTARVSNGVETTVYEGTLYDQMGDEVPEDRDRFLVVPIEAENTADEPRTIPDSTDSWDVLFGNQQLGNVFNVGALTAEGYEDFDGGDVQPGVHREGALLFEVDEGYETHEMDVLWEDRLWVSGDLDGDIDVRWSAGG